MTQQQEDINNFLKRNSEHTEQIAVEEGVIVCRAGQACTDLIIVTSGVVRVYKPSEDGRSISLYHISEGESCILTAGCIINNQPFPAIAETKTDVKGIAVPAPLVKRWMDESEVWRNYIFSILSQRFADVIDLANALAFEQLEDRIVTWILRNQCDGEITTTHQEIAEELGTSREVVSRKLKALENKDMISLSRGMLVVKDIEKLRLNRQVFDH